MSRALRLAALALSTLLAGAGVAHAGEMAAEIRQAEVVGTSLVRLNLLVFERDEGIRYPVTTFDRSMIRLEVDGAPGPGAPVKSLTTVGGSPGEIKRGLVVEFYGGPLRREEQTQGLRAAVAGLLRSLPSAYLAVGIVDGQGARRLGESRPGSAENVEAIKRQVLAAPQAGDSFSVAKALCQAAAGFDEWGATSFRPEDQKALVLIGPSIHAPSDPEAAGCAGRLVAAGVDVYGVDWPQGSDDSGASSEPTTLGEVRHLRSPLDLAPALQNVAAQLNGEYLVEAELPPAGAAASELGIRAVVDYHGKNVRTSLWRLALPHPAAVTQAEDAPAPAPADGRSDDAGWLPEVAFALVGLNVVIAGAIRVVRRRRSTKCNGCGRRVGTDYRDCPFRDPRTVARLVVLDGEHCGRTLPLHAGDNDVGSGRHRGVLQIKGTKALYLPARRGEDRINGWPVSEPRLLGNGAVMQIGGRRLRFEVRPDGSPK